MSATHVLPAGNGTIELDPATGAVAAVSQGNRRYVYGGAGTSGFVRMAVPTAEYPSHYLELGTHAAPSIAQIGDTTQLVYDGIRSGYADLAARITVELEPTDAGLLLRSTVQNQGEMTIPQLAFPQVLGLQAVGGTDGTRLQLARRRVFPFRELAMRPDDAWWLERRLQEHIPYGAKAFSMKWLDYGDEVGGLTLYSRNTRYTTQALVLDRQDRDLELLDIRWIHYPFIAPGETWQSGDYVLLLHEGDWHAGARAFQDFTRDAYPYNAPQHLREALAIRSVWPAVRNSPPTFRFDQLHTYADEVADPSLGIGEMVLWHWWLKNGLPIIIDERLGSQEDLESALARCAELGVKVSMFVSHNLVRQTEETDPDWRHLNAAGQPVEGNWTYGPDFLPRFQVPFVGTHAMVQASPSSRSWRETALAEYSKILDYGGTSICFDVFKAPADPEFNPAADGRPDEVGEKLIEFATRARELVHAHNPDGTFSGEFVSDTKLPVLDYTWEWTNSYEIADAAPFRYVFPQFRLNANVGTHPRGAITAFMEGALLNLIPGDMRSHHLADHPALLDTIRKLAVLRRRFLPYFTEGQFRAAEGLTITGGQARAYSLGEDVLVIATNPTDKQSGVAVRVDPTIWGGQARSRPATVYGLDGARLISEIDVPSEVTVELLPDTLFVAELPA